MHFFVSPDNRKKMTFHPKNSWKTIFVLFLTTGGFFTALQNYISEGGQYTFGCLSVGTSCTANSSHNEQSRILHENITLAIGAGHLVSTGHLRGSKIK